MDVQVRQCTAADAQALAVIGSATLLDAYAGFLPGQALLAHCAKLHRAEVYTEELARPKSRAWIAEVEPGAAPVGYALLTSPEFPPELVEAGDLELRRIYVLTRFHGGGAGKQLMDTAIASARAAGARHISLGLHAENHRAMAFYRRNGFVQVGNRRFKLGEVSFDDPVMRLSL